MANFQMIGSCAKAQAISLDEVIKRIDSDFYDINPDQDFSNVLLDGKPITMFSAGSIIELIYCYDFKQAELSNCMSFAYDTIKLKEKPKKSKKNKEARKSYKKFIKSIEAKIRECMIKTKNNQQISLLYSYLTHKCISGDIDAMRFFYGNICFEIPVFIKAVSLLQLQLASVKLRKKNYSNEFLYYWGMACIGEGSRIIRRNLPTAEICFKTIKKDVPKSESRLAFLELLKSTELYEDVENVQRIEVLREWAGKQDLFSMLSLSKIIFEQFLIERQADTLRKTHVMELPLMAIELLEVPCQKGHPEAIRFYNAVLEQLGTSESLSAKFEQSRRNVRVLFDF